MHEILERIANRSAELGLTESAVALRAGSKDMIRNWRRRADKGEPISAKHDSLVAIAAALSVSPNWLIYGEDTAGPDLPRATGMAEPATPFTLKPHATRLDDPQAALRAIFGPSATTPALFRVNTDMPGFAISAGDVVLADLARLPQPGEIAIVSVMDDTSASAVTMICRYLPPYLATGDIGFHAQTLRIDDPGVTVRHSVIGSIRGIAPD